VVATTKPRTFNGTSAKSYQEALDKAVAAAQKAAASGGGADRSVTWTQKRVTGKAGGITGRKQFKVAIEATFD
jgi:hypothetical protein